MNEPLLLFRPGLLRDRRNTPVTLTDWSIVSTTQGQYGDAWQVGVSGANPFASIQFAPTNLSTPFTYFFRAKRYANTSGYGINISGDYILPQNNMDIYYKPKFGLGYSYISDASTWVDFEYTTLSSTPWATVAVRVDDTSVRMFEDGVEIVVNTFNIDSYILQGSIRECTIQDSLAVESVLLFDSALTPSEIRYISRIQAPWTWENVQFGLQEPSPLIQEVALSDENEPNITTYFLERRMFKANRHNVLGEDISEYITNASVEYNPDRTVKFTLDATINDPTIITPYVDFLAPFVTIRYDDGHEVTSQLGLYGVVPPSSTINQQSTKIDIDGRDLTWLLSLDVFDTGYNVNAGANVVNTVKSILNGAGFTRINIQSSASTMTSTRSWKAGTTKITVINDLLNSIGYYSLTCGKDGTFISIPYVSIVNPTVVAEYDTTKRSYSKVLGEIKRDTTQDRIANKIVVVKDNANEAPIVATKINTNPASPTSTVTLGMTIAKVVTDTNVADQASAETIATRYLEEASLQYNKITMYTWPDVQRDINEVYKLNIVNPQGDVVADGIWRCRGWKIGLRAGDRMQHDLSNIDEPPMDIG